jgi:acetolactate synthase I/II/III large subunit
MAAKKTGAEIIWECLLREGVEVVFGYPGGMILPAYDALTLYPQIHHVLVRHEQGAAHMADGYARASGKVGVAMATSGPGATNLITGMATAMMDSIPIVFITGQSPTSVLGSDAFQEVDVTGVSLPIAKHTFLVTDIHDLVESIRQAFHIARSGRPGPVLIDVPKDIQNALLDFEYPDEPVTLPGYRPPLEATEDQVALAISLINQAERPVILAGHGVLMSGAQELVRRIAEKGQIPITATLLGIGCIPASHPLYLGMMGMHGEAPANHAIQEADLLLAFGMRFDDRATSKVETYSPKSKKIHIDIDPSELNKNVRVDVAIKADLRAALRQIAPHVQEKERNPWLERIALWRADAARRDIINQPKNGTIFAAQVIHEICRFTEGKAVIVTDVGQHQMLAAQYYRPEGKFPLITSGGLGTMGFGLPAAIGARFALPPEEEVWAIIGDGGIQMTVRELGTAVQENSNIKIAIMNNGYLGMVRQLQELFYERRYSETPISSPDFLKLAEAYCLKGFRVGKHAEIQETLQAAREINGPVLIEFIVHKEDMVYPMVPAGADLHAMIRRPVIENAKEQK